MLSSVEFIGVFMIVLALMLWSLWCDHKQQQQAKADAMVDDVFDRIEECMDVCDIERMEMGKADVQHGEDVQWGTYWFTGDCVSEFIEEQHTLVLRDELFGSASNIDGVWLMSVQPDMVWLAEMYVEEGLLHPVEVTSSHVQVAALEAPGYEHLCVGAVTDREYAGVYNVPREELRAFAAVAISFEPVFGGVSYSQSWYDSRVTTPNLTDEIPF